MSYDIRILSQNAPIFPDCLPLSEKWKLKGDGGYVYSGEDWKILVGAPQKVEPEDVPDEAVSLLKGILYQIGMILEPLGAPSVGYDFFKLTQKTIAEQSEGLILDSQTGAYSLPSGKKKIIETKKKDEITLTLGMQWKYCGSQSVKETIESIIDVLEKYFPEALPRRYGTCEPPEFKYKEAGREHFVQFVSDNNNVVWYPSKPVLYVGWHFQGDCDFKKLARIVNLFSVNYLSFQIDAGALEQSEWQEKLLTAFKEISLALQAFYGEARILPHSYDIGSESWTGIPRTLGQAVVVGEPYLAHWQNMKKRGEPLGKSLYFSSMKSWRFGECVSKKIGEVPRSLFLIEQDFTSVDHLKYPAIFPFRSLVQSSSLFKNILCSLRSFFK